MRIVVMSDSHGNYNRVKEVVEQQMETAHTFIHLGDGLEEFEDVHHLYPYLHFVAVKGNNDWGSTELKVRTLVCGDKNLLLCHGDLYNVKYSLELLRRTAIDAKADVALYGHTHRAQSDYLDGLYLVNPGCLCGSYGGKSSYLLLDITPQGIVPVPVELSH
ncbi:MAG: YfcE family phosphodiesterase [Angelakisella sp.]